MGRNLQREQAAFRPLTGHLKSWSPQEAAQAGRDVAALMEHPGFDVLVRSLELRERALLHEQLVKPASENAAEYAKALGAMAGLRELRPLAEGVVKNGRNAEDALRRSEETHAA